MIVATIEQRHADGMVGERPGRVEPAEAAAHDHHMRDAGAGDRIAGRHGRSIMPAITAPLTSQRYRVDDFDQAIEFCYERGWTDGLPVVPPTEASVGAMLDAAGLEPAAEIAFITNRQVAVTAEKVAINAVMAGCLPAYMPIVVAANERIAEQLGFNSGDNLFGPGWRANATVGRAVRLVMRNVIGTLPGRLDRATVGHPGKYTYVIAENEAESPWPPLHVERGFAKEQSAVTVMSAEGPRQFYNQLSSTPEGILATLCDDMRHHNSTGAQPQYVVVIAGEHMRTISAAGWSKADIRKHIFDQTQNPLAQFKRTERLGGAIKPEDETTLRSLVAGPEDILVVAAC